MSKYYKQRFHSQFVPVKLATVDTGDSNAPGDWHRIGNEDATINGQPIKSYRDQYNNFSEGTSKAQEQNTKQFFSDVVLKDLDETIDKGKVTDYLYTALHQGGLLYPVSAPIASELAKAPLELQPINSESSRQIRITSTPKGFQIMEIYTAKKLVEIGMGSGDEGPQTYQPDPGKNYVLKVGARVDVDFSTPDFLRKAPSTQNNQDSPTPDIKIKSSFISYGNDEIKEKMGKRDIKKILVDFFRRVLGLNTLKVTKSPAKDEASQEKSPSPSLSMK